jgi:ketosteroid isomerase-like protein
VAQQPIDVVRAQFDATNARDFERAMDMYADDVVLVVAESWGLGSGRFEGKKAVGEWFGDWFQQFADDYHFKFIETRDLGDGWVLLVAEHGGSGRSSGAPIGAESGYLYRVKGDRIDRVQLFPSPAEAREASSLPGRSDPQTG